jgi:uncharacterized protein YkwD
MKKSKKSAWILAAALISLIATGCAPPGKKTIVVRKKPHVRCTSTVNIEKQMVRLINRARASGGKCGGKRYRPAATVYWNDALAKAARRHSKNMAGSNRLGHRGSGNSTVEKRVRRAGYTWQAVGENVAGGLNTCEAVVSGWLKSPGHCANIMDPAFTHIGAACEQNSKSRYGTYWTLVLAAPLK